MAVNSIIKATSAAESEWNEEKLASSLSRLNEMHIQLRHLRGTIPRIIDSMLLPESTPEQLYSNFERTATTAARDIESFTRLMKDPRSQAILHRAKKSRAESSEGITGWMVADHPDWLDVQKEAYFKNSTDEVKEGNKPSVIKEEDHRVALKKLEESHPSVKTSLPDAGSNIMEIYLSPPTRLRFKVEPKPSLQKQTFYNVTSLEKSKLHSAILDEVANRPNPNNLNYLLEMLASYASLKSSPCLKCNRLMDPTAQFPVVRTRIRTKAADNHHITQWQAFHKSCT